MWPALPPRMRKAAPDSSEGLRQAYFKCQSLSGNHFASHSCKANVKRIIEGIVAVPGFSSP